MERRRFFRGGLAGVLTAAPVVAAGQPEVHWRLASSFPRSLDTLFGTSETFAKKVGELTGGRFRISTHAGGELVPPFAVVDAVSNATVEMAHTAAYYFFGKDETFALGCAIPFGLNARQMAAWTFDGNGLKLMREFYRAFNIVNFPMGNTGAQMGGWFRKEIRSVDDLKGLKFRVGGFAGAVLQRLGAVPQNIPGGEVYVALERGTIDAAEWVGPYDDQRLGFHKVAPYYHYPGWWEGSAQGDLYVNAKAFDGLPVEFKAAIECAAAVAHVESQARYDARNPAALRQLVASGAKLVRFPQAVMEAALAESLKLCSEIAARNPNWKRVYDDYSAFRREQHLWFRIAEAEFDRFMQQNQPKL
jgi:TRAP-type mannitol/chloroaromatic compound transport system substrate-binding protein